MPFLAKLLFSLLLVTHAAYSHDLIITPFADNTATGEMVSIQPDGNILMVGTLAKNGQSNIALVRYLKNGEVDESFGNKGTTIIQNDLKHSVFGLVLQPDGKIVIGGSVQKNEQENFYILRLLSDGKTDTAFGKNGYAITHFSHPAELHYIALQSDRKIVAAGFLKKENDNDFLVARYDTTGSLDTTFGTQGFVQTDITKSDRLYGLTIQSDDKILVTGSVLAKRTAEDCAVARYHSNGQLDDAFGQKGLATLATGPHEDCCSALALQEDGKIVVTGFSMADNADFMVGRLLANGNMDTTFGKKGLVKTDFMDSQDVAHAIAVQNDGKILVAGEAGWLDQDDQDKSGFALLSYYPDGSLDTSEGEKGKVIFRFKAGTGSAETMTHNSEKVVMGGRAGKDFAMIIVSSK